MVNPLKSLYVALALASAILLPQAAGAANDLPAPTGPVVLTISGRIAHTNSPEGAQFDVAMLEALPMRTAKVDTPYDPVTTDYTGPIAREVLKLVGASGQTLKISALDNYSIESPMSDFDKLDIIFATRQFGKLMTPRNKGPIFVMYPLDLDPGLRREEIFNRLVWQVTKIEVK